MLKVIVDEEEGRMNNHLMEIDSEYFNCFNRILT